MNYAAMYEYDTLNSIDGFSLSLFVSGCGKTPKCRMCHNQKAWDFNYGKTFTLDTKNEVINKLGSNFIKTFCILGGEPMDNLADGTLIDLVKTIKNKFPEKKICCWTGYKYEDLIRNDLKLEFIRLLDILIDGEFIPELKNLSRPLANSTNQRIINIKETVNAGVVVQVDY